MPANITLTMFTPAEAERITGVSTDKQRDWRRHGYLPSSDGHARFDIFALAKMTVMGMLAEHGIGPKRSNLDSVWSAQFIAYRALEFREAWEGDDTRSFPSIDEKWRAPALLNTIWREARLSAIMPTRYTVWWANSEATFINSVDEEVERYVSSETSLAGPFLVIEHTPIASLIIDRAGRALCHVEWSDEE